MATIEYQHLKYPAYPDTILEYEYRLKLANSIESFEGFKWGYEDGLHPRKNQSL